MSPDALKNLTDLACAAMAMATRRCGLLVLLVLAGAVAQGATIADFYTATVRVKDRSEVARTEAFAMALGVVLTKVSGRSDAPERVGAAVGHAERYVQRYSYLNSGQLEVGFDGAAVGMLLEQAGLPLWDRDRPLTLVVYPNALQGLREAYATTEQSAKTRGVPVVWANALNSESFAPGSLPQIQELAGRYGAAAVLLARPGPGEVSAANLRWQMVFNGTTQERLGSAEEGPNLAAEVLGRYYAAAGKEWVRVSMEVSGVDSLAAYARTVGYLNGLLMVRNVAVESLQRDVLRLQVELRGNQDALRRAMAVDQKLVETALAPEAAAAVPAVSPAVLSYRYNN